MFPLPNTPQPTIVILETGIRLYLISFSRLIPFVLAIAFLKVSVDVLFPQLQSDDSVAVGQALFDLLPYFPLFLSVALIFYGAIFCRLGAGLMGEVDSDARAIFYTMRFLLPLFVGTLLYGVVVGLGMFLIIPGVIFLVSLAFFIPIVLFERVGGVAALLRSHELAWKYWWRTALVLFIALSVQLFVTVFLTNVVVLFLGGILDLSELRVLGILISSLVNPLFDAILLILYHDLRVREAIARGDALPPNSQGTFVA